MTLPYKYEQLKPLRQKKIEQYAPDQQQIIEYAEYIGIQLPQQQYMLDLAKQGINTTLPEDWQACHAPDGQLVYRNTKTKVVQEQHPVDNVFRLKVIQLRKAYNRYLQQQAEELQQSQQLNTIPQQKSQDKSAYGQQQIDDLVQPSKQLLQPGNTLKPQQNSYLDKGMIGSSKQKQSSLFQNQKSLSNQNRQTSKFLNNIFSLQHTQQYKLPQQNEGIKIEPMKKAKKNKMKELNKQEMKKQLQFLKMQQKISQQLLTQLQKQNQQKMHKLKQKMGKKKKNKNSNKMQ